MSDKDVFFDDLPRATLDASPDTIYILDRSLTIRYCNPAWDNFARQNFGEEALAEHVLGRPVFGCIPAVLQPFYREVFDACISDQEPFAFNYECSSAAVFRLFRMQVLPLKRSGGLAVLNSLRLERPHAPAHEVAREYFGRDDVVVMCAHCRRARSAFNPSRWDFVPRLLNETAIRISHGLCPVCLAYFYSDTLKGKAVAGAS